MKINHYMLHHLTSYLLQAEVE